MIRFRIAYFSDHSTVKRLVTFECDRQRDRQILLRLLSMKLQGYNVRWSGQLFRSFEIKLFCFVVAVSDLVHDGEAIHCLSLLLTTSGNLFCNLQFHRHHSYFRKDFQMLIAV